MRNLRGASGKIEATGAGEKRGVLGQFQLQCLQETAVQLRHPLDRGADDERVLKAAFALVSRAKLLQRLKHLCYSALRHNEAGV